VILKLNETPETLVAFVACEEITREDFDKVVLPAAHELVQRTGKLNCLLVVADTIKKLTLDLRMREAMPQLTLWNRVGIVTDRGRISWLTALFHKLIPVEFKAFEHHQIEQAVKWVGEQSE
jgi:hypothetical protein